MGVMEADARDALGGWGGRLGGPWRRVRRRSDPAADDHAWIHEEAVRAGELGGVRLCGEGRWA